METTSRQSYNLIPQQLEPPIKSLQASKAFPLIRNADSDIDLSAGRVDTERERTAIQENTLPRSEGQAMSRRSDPLAHTPPLEPPFNSNTRWAGLQSSSKILETGCDDGQNLSPESSRKTMQRHPTFKIMVFSTDVSSEPAVETSPLRLTHPDQAVGPSTPVFGRSRTLMKRLGYLRPSTSRMNSRYKRLEDDIELRSQIILNQKSVQKMEQDEDLSYMDVSTLEGPMAMQTFGADMYLMPQPTSYMQRHPSTTRENMLESNGKLTGGLGRGMGSFREAIVSEVFTGDDTARPASQRTKKSIARSITSKSRGSTMNELRENAYFSPIPEEVVDLSNAEWLPQNTGDLSTTSQTTADSANKSYYFPPDPQMPDWRPFTMRWFYIVFLILAAITLAGVEEYLCQLSQKLSTEPQGGLLKFINPQDVSNLDYFIWKYFPTLILVLYGVLWQTTDFEVKRLEPYYQLSQPSGATADESLNIDYLTFWFALVPFKALRYKQWAVMLASCSTILAGTFTPIFQSAAVIMYPPQNERINGEPKYIRIDPLWSRLMEVTLIFVAISGLLLLLQLRRRSGLLSDPKGIAGIAAMANRSHILTDFKGLDTADHGLIHKQLKNRRYILHKSSLWQGEYRKVAFEDHPPKSENPHPIMLRVRFGMCYIAFMFCFFSLIPIFIFTDANFVTEKLPWLLTAMATIVQLIWNTLECNIRMTEPFYVLSKRQAPPKTLTLDYTGTIPIWLPIKALLNCHWVVFIVGLGSIMTQILTVLVSSFDVDGKIFFPGRSIDLPAQNPTQITSIASSNYTMIVRTDTVGGNTDQTFKSFWVSLSLALTILVALSIFSTCIYIFRRHPFLPRQPGTIASVLAFIHQSKMLYDFVGTEEFGTEKMTRHLEGMGKLYGLGWYQGRDGEDHCGVDEEVLLANYKHGEDWRRGRVNLGQVGSWEHY